MAAALVAGVEPVTETNVRISFNIPCQNNEQEYILSSSTTFQSVETHMLLLGGALPAKPPSLYMFIYSVSMFVVLVKRLTYVIPTSVFHSNITSVGYQVLQAPNNGGGGGRCWSTTIYVCVNHMPARGI